MRVNRIGVEVSENEKMMDKIADISPDTAKAIEARVPKQEQKNQEQQRQVSNDVGFSL